MLLERRAGLGRRPTHRSGRRRACSRRSRSSAAAPARSPLEQGGVVVGRVTVDVDDVGLGLAGVVEALGQTLAHQLADLHVVERHVVRRAAAEGEPVVVDARDAGVGRLLQAGGTRLGVEVDDHQDLDALVDHAVADACRTWRRRRRRSGCRLDAGVVERRLQAGPVVGLPARRGGRRRAGSRRPSWRRRRRRCRRRPCRCRTPTVTVPSARPTAPTETSRLALKLTAHWVSSDCLGLAM